MFTIKPGLKLILASSSPRRISLLESLGIEFSIQAPQITEPQPQPGEDPEDFVLRCASVKATGQASQIQAGNDTVILAADTVVALGKRILGKPSSMANAVEMLAELNGQTHTVFTGVAILAGSELHSFSAQTKVKFLEWPLEVLEAYAKSGDPLDKAGAYGIQGPGGFLIEKIEGSASNVAGLPLAQVMEELLKLRVLIPARI